MESGKWTYFCRLWLQGGIPEVGKCRNHVRPSIESTTWSSRLPVSTASAISMEVKKTWSRLASIWVCGSHCVWPDILSYLYSLTAHHKTSSPCFHIEDVLRCKAGKWTAQSHMLIVEAAWGPEVSAPSLLCHTTLLGYSNENRHTALLCHKCEYLA